MKYLKSSCIYLKLGYYKNIYFFKLKEKVSNIITDGKIKDIQIMVVVIRKVFIYKRNQRFVNLCS